MDSILRDLISQYFPGTEEVPPRLAAFLEDLSTKLSGEFSPESLQRDTSKINQVSAKFINSVNEIVRQLAALDQSSLIIETLTTQVCEQFDLTKTQFFSFNKAANHLRLSAVAGENPAIPDGQASVLPLTFGAVGRAATKLETVIFSTMELDTQTHPQMFGFNIKSQVALPITLNGDLFGILDVQSNEEIGVNGELVQMLESLCLQTAILLKGQKVRDVMHEQLNKISSRQISAFPEDWNASREMGNLSSTRFIYDQNLGNVVLANPDDQPTSSLQNPLEIRGEVIGALGISTDPDQPLTPEEINLLESVSNEVAEALERARLLESSQRSASELAVLNAMGAAFAQAENEEFILENIYQYTTKLMETPQFYVALYHEEEEQISFPYVNVLGERVTEGHPEFHQWHSRPAGTGLTGYIIENKNPILIDSNAEQTLQELGLPFMRFGDQTDSWLGVPMILGDRILGVISVQSETTPNLYTNHHLDLLMTIASQAAVAINNTRLFNQEQSRAEQERTVRTITDKVRRGTDTQNIMQIALMELSEVLKADISVIQLGNREELLERQKRIEMDQSIPQNGEET